MIQQERPAFMNAASHRYDAPLKRLLLIGNDSDTQFIVTIALEEFEQWHIGTSDSQNFPDQLDAARWDTVLLDISPYENSAVRCFRLLETHSSTATVPVVMLSSVDGCCTDRLAITGTNCPSSSLQEFNTFSAICSGLCRWGTIRFCWWRGNLRWDAVMVVQAFDGAIANPHQRCQGWGAGALAKKV